MAPDSHDDDDGSGAPAPGNRGDDADDDGSGAPAPGNRGDDVEDDGSDPSHDDVAGNEHTPAGDAGGVAGGDHQVAGDDTPAGGRREIEVPLRLYKTVTVFSTLIAIVLVVTGFVLLDAATVGVGIARRVVDGLLAALAVSPPADLLSGVLAALGLASIAVGAVVYVFGTRFRAPGMGNAEGDADERSDNG